MKKLKNCLTLIFGIALSAMLSSCTSTGSAVVTGKVRPAIPKEQVQVYLEAPASYEIIGLVESIGYAGMTDQSRMNRAIEELKARAGRIGANGVLLESTGNATGATVGSINNGFLVAGNPRHKTATGKAIWVPTTTSSPKSD
jgi:hypothetical protein